MFGIVQKQVVVFDKLTPTPSVLECFEQKGGCLCSDGIEVAKWTYTLIPYVYGSSEQYEYIIS